MRRKEIELLAATPVNNDRTVERGGTAIVSAGEARLLKQRGRAKILRDIAEGEESVVPAGEGGGKPAARATRRKGGKNASRA